MWVVVAVGGLLMGCTLPFYVEGKVRTCKGAPTLDYSAVPSDWSSVRS